MCPTPLAIPSEVHPMRAVNPLAESVSFPRIILPLPKLFPQWMYKENRKEVLNFCSVWPGAEVHLRSSSNTSL